MTAVNLNRDVAAAAAGATAPYRVMLVDDSAVIRGLLARTLGADPEVEIVASVRDGQAAVLRVARHDIDVVVLDIEMPVMDGLTALPKLLAASPGVKIVMASTMTRRNAEISLKCLASGAHDYIPKPTSGGELTRAADFKRDLLEKVKALGAAKRGRPAQRAPSPDPTVVSQTPAGPIALRQSRPVPPNAIGVGSSTGGPQALFTLLSDIAPTLRVPVLISQHMPATFTTILAEHIGRLSGCPCHEGKDGEAVQRGHIYIAPGNYHMTVEASGGEKVIHLNQDPPENYCRPSVDPMLRSMAIAYGPSLLTIILTGMGHDGLRGCESAAAAGGAIIAQDEKTSVVWGMPGAAANAGLCTSILPLPDIGPYVLGLQAGPKT